MAEKVEKTDKAAKSSRAEKAEKAEKKARAVTEARDRAAMQFKALGDPTRLRILDLLRAHAAGAVAETPHFVSPADAAADLGEETLAAFPDGSLTVGAVSVGIGGREKVSSTLSHHLKELRQAGLITMKRNGKHQHCRLHPEAVEQLRCYLWLPDRHPTPTELRDQDSNTNDNDDINDDTSDTNDAISHARRGTLEPSEYPSAI